MNNFTGKLPKIFIATFFFEIAMAGCFKNSNKLFSRKTMNACGWMKKR